MEDFIIGLVLLALASWCLRDIWNRLMPSKEVFFGEVFLVMAVVNAMAHGGL